MEHICGKEGQGITPGVLRQVVWADSVYVPYVLASARSTLSP